MSYLGPTSHENLDTTTPRRGLAARLRAWWCKQPDVVFDRYGRITAIQCPCCTSWRTDPTLPCGRCAL